MTMQKKQPKIAYLILACIVIGGIFLRTYKLHEALGDWHSWRQADTASVAREYVKAGKINLFSPRFHDLSSIPSGHDNPEGWRMVEFPLRDGLHAWSYMHFPQIGFLEWGRILSIIFSAITIIVIYGIVVRLSGQIAALFASLIYAILPYNIFYGRVILPEPMLIMCTMLTLLSYMKYADSKKLIYWFATVISLVLALLLKPTALIILLPMVGYFFVTSGKTMKLFCLSAIMPILAIIPYYLWRQHIAMHSEGIPASSWLFNGNGIRFKGAWFRWLFGERISKLILGYWGVIPLGFGLARLGEVKKETMVYGGLLLGSLAYLAVIATGNVQHDYYQTQIMPTIAILVGVGISYMLTLKRGIAKIFMLALVMGILLLSCALSWYELKGYFWVNNRAMVEAGQYIDAHTPADSLIIAPYQGDTAFLFQTNRRGWPIGGQIEDKIKAGAGYYVTTTRDAEFNELKTKYGVILENDRFAVIKL